MPEPDFASGFDALAPPFIPPKDGRIAQVLHVRTGERGPTRGTLDYWTRTDTGWRRDGSGIPVSLGRNGMISAKREGDGCTPRGFYALPSAFGRWGAMDWRACRLRFKLLHDELYAVDDPSSRYYNRIVDARKSSPDWTSAEAMGRMDARYDLGLVIRHNARRRPGHGSCIFIHLWQAEGVPTAGCVAMAREDMQALLRWLNPAHRPHILIE